MHPWMLSTMIILRFLGITVISFLLLSPLIKKTTENIEKPVIIVAQDNSLSVTYGNDSVFYKTEYQEKLKDLTGQLKKKYDVAFFSFGEKITSDPAINFHERQTDISELLDDLKSRYSNRNIGALILATDGIYNKGSNPYYSTLNMNYPIFTVAMGDTILTRDIIIKKINYNPTVFKGDKFPVEINVSANKCEGETTEIIIKRKDQILFNKKITFPSIQSTIKVNTVLDARENGNQRFMVIVNPVKDEISKLNNQQDLMVEVSETRQKIAILYQSPHPDISVLRNALESSLRFEVEEYKADEFTGPVDKYDLIILYQVPSLLGISNLSRFLSFNGSLLICLGSQTDLNSFNSIKTGLEITTSKTTYVESLPQWNESFPLFTMDKGLIDVIREFPPLLSPYGTFHFSPAADVLFEQKIGNVASNIPLILFLQNSGKKIGIIAGENLWKWSLSDYQQKGNHDVFNELINKIAQYLSVKADKSFFRVKTKTRFQENELIEFDGEVYNKSYELINEPDVNLIITDEQGKTFPFVFGRTDKAYYLNAGNFPIGSYKYTASVKVGNNRYEKKGEFVISALNLELMNTTADHNLLFKIARSHDGEMVSPHDINQLYNLVNKREDIRPVSYLQKRYADLAGNIWVFLLILLLISAEWFIRKRTGIY